MMTFAAQARLLCNLTQSKPDGKRINQWEAATWGYIPPSGEVITASEENQRAAEANSPIKEPDWSPASAASAVMRPDAYLDAHVPPPSRPPPPLYLPFRPEYWMFRCVSLVYLPPWWPVGGMTDGSGRGLDMLQMTLVTFRIVTRQRVTPSRLFGSRLACVSLSEMDTMALPKLKFHPSFCSSFDKPQFTRKQHPAAWLRGAVFCFLFFVFFLAAKFAAFRTFCAWRKDVNKPIFLSLCGFTSLSLRFN